MTPTLHRSTSTLLLALLLAPLAAIGAENPEPRPGFTTTGRWDYSMLVGHEPGKASVWSGDRDATATWNPQIRSVAPVRLSLWLVTHKGNSPEVQVEIVHNGKTDTVSVNMADGAPRWLALGKFRLCRARCRSSCGCGVARRAATSA